MGLTGSPFFVEFDESSDGGWCGVEVYVFLFLVLWYDCLGFLEFIVGVMWKGVEVVVGDEFHDFCVVFIGVGDYD
jgi:hypothetical protein